MTHNQLCDLYIASCTKDGGIERFGLSCEGKLSKIDLVKMDRPMYMIESEGRMHVILRAPFDTSDESGYQSYRIDSDGDLCDSSDILSTKGVVACHIAVFNSIVYAVNYLSGSVVKIPDTVVKHEGKGVNMLRQEMPHTHYVSRSPDGKYLFVTDLGIDTVFVYDRNLSFVSSVKIPSGHGPRHLAFHEDNTTVFCANELTSTISVLKYSDGILTLDGTYDGLPKGFSGESTAAAIRCVGDRVYVSNRGHDSVGVFEYDGEALSNVGFYSTYGNGPRDFIVVDDYLVVTNEISDNVTVVSLKNGELVDCVSVASPICVLAR